jgi:phospholipase A1/A2
VVLMAMPLPAQLPAELGTPILPEPPDAEAPVMPPAPAEDPATPAQKGPASRPKLSERLDYSVDPDAYSIVSTTRGLSTHRPMFLYPLTYSPDYPSEETEVLFQISVKQRLFGTQMYFGYTQKSFWQLYNGGDSRPFRDTNYNPELFYRWILDPKRFHRWNLDIGYEHESNGRPIPESRSWDRLYVAPFLARGRSLLYLKFWYRIPESGVSSTANPGGDDNPDILDYYGHGELTFSRQLGGKQLLTTMLRGNPETGRGAVSLTWSVPTAERYAFYAVSLFHGYGEGLLDYNDSVTRLALGVMLTR